MDKTTLERLAGLARLIRYDILVSSTAAGSGHPTSSLSAVELMAVLLFGGVFRYDPSEPDHPNNDRLIFSKGHASPLYYSLWAAAGLVSEDELKTMRKFGSPLEGHPTARFRYAEAATGSLGQGLSIGVGMALNGRALDRLPYRTFVLLGDSECAEGSVWEAMEIAAHYGLDNLVGILDVNRLGQRGETMYGHDLAVYERRVAAFGWETVVVENGHDLAQVADGYDRALRAGRPAMLIARTLKGKGVPFFEDKDDWHGKPLPGDQLDAALKGLGEVDRGLRGEIAKPEDLRPDTIQPEKTAPPEYDPATPVATRKAYGQGLARIYKAYPDIVALDGEVSNSTYAEIFKKAHPDRFFEMYIAEQNMVGVAQGLARRGKIPFVSTFAAFFARAFDQIRMSRYSDANIKLCGSHAGVSIGEDGPSQMGLEDLAMFRTVADAVVLYPSDPVAADRLVEAAAAHRGLVYLRTTRGALPTLYGPDEAFPIGGSKVLKKSDQDQCTVVAAGVTLHEALAAHAELAREGIMVRVIDLYSVKPVDEAALNEAAKVTGAIVTVEDHAAEGGLGEAVRSALVVPVPVITLAVRRVPMSGKPDELLAFEDIDKDAIVRAVRDMVGACA
jgi:transketolase